MDETLAVKIFVALVGLFSMVLVFVVTQDVFFLDIKPYGVDFKNIEGKDITLFELNASNVKTNYRAFAWERYNEKDVFSGFEVFGWDYNLSSNELVLQDNNITMRGNVLYTDINATRIESESLNYDKKGKFLLTNDDFVAYRGDEKLMGSGLDYDINEKKLNIRGVKLWLHSK